MFRRSCKSPNRRTRWILRTTLGEVVSSAAHGHHAVVKFSGEESFNRWVTQ
jgi:hypothetical protein